jgi:diamine N-acetyltransferase
MSGEPVDDTPKLGEPAADPWRAADEAMAAWSEVTKGEDAALRAPGPPRSVAEGGVVELREVTEDNVRAVCRLAVAPSQAGFVAPNAVSLAQALVSPLAWYRAIYADDQPVGFAMLSIDAETPEYYLWRLMIGRDHQRKGFGAAAMRLIADHVRALPGGTALITSWVPVEGGPEPFYRGLGFVPTGEVDDGEHVGRLELGG